MIQCRFRAQDISPKMAEIIPSHNYWPLSESLPSVQPKMSQNTSELCKSSLQHNSHPHFIFEETAPARLHHWPQVSQQNQTTDPGTWAPNPRYCPSTLPSSVLPLVATWHLLSTGGQGQRKRRWVPSGRGLLWDDLVTLGKSFYPCSIFLGQWRQDTEQPSQPTPMLPKWMGQGEVRLWLWFWGLQWAAFPPSVASLGSKHHLKSKIKNPSAHSHPAFAANGHLTQLN